MKEVTMCPFKNHCSFYNESKDAKLSEREHNLMKEIFCDSELFMLNKDCKIFLLYQKSQKPTGKMMPVG